MTFLWDHIGPLFHCGVIFERRRTLWLYIIHSLHSALCYLFAELFAIYMSYKCESSCFVGNQCSWISLFSLIEKFTSWHTCSYKQTSYHQNLCFLKPVQFWLFTNTGSSNLNYCTVVLSSSFDYWVPYFITVHLFFN